MNIASTELQGLIIMKIHEKIERMIKL